MTDDELVSGFETGALARRGGSGTKHLRLAWCSLARFGREETERRLLAGLRAFAARAGKPDKFDAALTSAWVGVLADASAQLESPATFDALIAARPELLEPRQPCVRAADAIIPDTHGASSHPPHPPRDSPHRHAHRRPRRPRGQPGRGTRPGASRHRPANPRSGRCTAAFGHKRSTLTSILDRLEERRLIARTSDERDRRTFVVSLTKSGRPRHAG